MKLPAHLKSATPLIVWLAFFVAAPTHAQINNSGLLDSILGRYSAAATSWANVITDAATWLFWTLVVISMVWTFGMMALRKADIGEFFAEFVRFTIFTGFFWWLLINGPDFALSIYDSLRQIAGNATTLGPRLSPSGVVDVAFKIFDRVLDQSSLFSPVDSVVGMLVAFIILVIVALIGTNMLLLLIAGWVLAYGGVFFLGFGGSRWTSDMAINYYKTVLGVAVQLMAMVLLIGIGKTFLDDYYNQMNEEIGLDEMGVMLIVAVILLSLVNKVPQLLSGIITGASVGGAGIGQFGAGAVVGAAGMAGAAAAVGGAAMAAGAANMAGGAQALMAAVSKASDNVASGSDVVTSMLGGGGGDGGGGGGDSSTGSTPFAQAAGFGGASSMSGGNEGGDAKGRPESDSSSSDQAKGGGFMAAAAKAGKIAADAGANLAKGTADVAMSKATSMKESAMDRIADTTPGKVAAAIKGQTGPTFAGNSLGDVQSEVAAFVNRDNGNKSA